MYLNNDGQQTLNSKVGSLKSTEKKCRHDLLKDRRHAKTMSISLCFYLGGVSFLFFTLTSVSIMEHADIWNSGGTTETKTS